MAEFALPPSDHRSSSIHVTSTFFTGKPDTGKKSYASKTIVTVLDTGAETTLVSASPLTGRRQKLRVHLAWVGLPIAGDPLFRSTSDSFPCTLLHCYRLGISLPWLPSGITRLEALPTDDFRAACDHEFDQHLSGIPPTLSHAPDLEP